MDNKKYNPETPQNRCTRSACSATKVREFSLLLYIAYWAILTAAAQDAWPPFGEARAALAIPSFRAFFHFDNDFVERIGVGEQVSDFWTFYVRNRRIAMENRFLHCRAHVEQAGINPLQALGEFHDLKIRATTENAGFNMFDRGLIASCMSCRTFPMFL